MKSKKKSAKQLEPNAADFQLKDAAVADEIEHGVETEPMIRTQIYISRPEYDFVNAEAKRRGSSMAAVIREFIEAKMEVPEDAWTNNPMLKPTPADPDFNLPEDAAINHDHYLYGAPKKYAKVKGQWNYAAEADN